MCGQCPGNRNDSNQGVPPDNITLDKQPDTDIGPARFDLLLRLSLVGHLDTATSPGVLIDLEFV
jgi:hypothetical protein